MRAEVFLQALLTFIVVAFGQPSFGPWLGPIAALAGYAFFWRAIRIYPFKLQRFWRGALWYGAVTVVQLSWMTSIEFQGIYILFVWIALSIWMGIQFGLLTLLIPYNRKLTFPRILAIAASWTFLEWSRYFVLCGYSWNPSGLALSNIFAVQGASIFGVLGLSFWVIFSNLIGLRALVLKRIPHYVLWVFIALIPYLYGGLHLAYHDNQIAKNDSPRISCALVQTGLLPPEKIPIQGKIRSFISPYDQWRRMLFFLKEHINTSPDLILFPEAVVPFSSSAMIYDDREVENIFFQVFGKRNLNIFPEKKYPFGESQNHKVSNTYWAQSIANLFNSEVIIGFDYEEQFNGVSYNSAFHAIPFKQNLDRYDKQILMPLAEYLPYRWLGPLVRYYGIADFFTPGNGACLFTGKVPIAASICYEETFPQKIREGRLLGARLFANVTNDGWYPSSTLPRQHFELAKLRAIENGCPLVRACNTGITSALDGFGRVVGKMEERDLQKNRLSGVLFANIDIYDYNTLYTFWGNWGILSLSLLFVFIFTLLKNQFNW